MIGISQTRNASCIAFALLLLFFRVDPVHAQANVESPTRHLVAQAIDENKLVQLAGNTRSEANAANDRGRVSDDFALDHMEIQLRLPVEKEQELEQLIGELHDPNSPRFHNWLTADQFRERFSPAPEDIDAVSRWLQSRGFTINVIYPRSIDFSGTAGQVRDAFQTEIHKLEVNGVVHIANMSDPQIPVALAPVVVGVFAMSNLMPRPMMHPRIGYTLGGGTYAMAPADLATIYNFNPLFAEGYSGQGQTIVVIEDSDVSSSTDWSTFRSTLGLSTYGSGSFTQVHPGPPSGSNNCKDPGVNGDDAEAILDAEWASAAAPSANVLLASCRNTTNFGGFIALQNLLNASGTPPAIVSISYGTAESELGSANNAAINALYQQAVTEGVSVFVAVGDQGAAAADPEVPSATHGIGVSGFASTPYNVSVGGTDFGDTYAGTNGTYWNSSNSTNYGSAQSYVPEIPWNDSCASGLIASYLGFESSSGSGGFCNSSTGGNFLTTGAGSGGPSGCATGSPSIGGIVGGSCAGYAKPSWQSLVGNPGDGVRDVPDVSLFAANGIWGHYYIVCYSDLSRGGTACSGAPSTWSGFGGTSVASPVMAGMQALVNQATGSSWGNPNPTYYSLAGAEYGAAGATSCNSTLGFAAAQSCIFYDETQGDIDVDCTGAQNCYLPSGTYGALSTSSSSFERAYGTTVGWDFATGIGTVNVYNLATSWPNSLLRITTTSLPNGEVGTAYSTGLTAAGGTTPYVWTLVSGTFPGGLTLGSSTGVISGTPTSAANATSLTFKVTDSTPLTQTANVSLTLTISSASLMIATASLANGQVGTSYSQTLTATGGTAPYTWTLVSGTLPGGLTLNSSTGLISGTPTAAVNATALTFKVMDSNSPAQTINANLTLTISSASLMITTASLANGQVGASYSQTLTAAGGASPYTWTLISGTLPGGLTLNSSVGLISGTPTVAVNATPLTFKVTDSSSPAQTINTNLMLTISPATLTITTASLAIGQVGTTYSQALTATGGTLPYTWGLISGSLPGGLTLNSLTGLISGTPTAAVNPTALTFKVTDSGSPAQTANASLTLTTSSATLTITTASLAIGQVGTAYSQALTASGGTPPYAWSLTSGTLQAGLTLNALTGAISGIPTVVVNGAVLTIKVTDSSVPPEAANASLTLTTVYPFNVTLGASALNISSPGGSSSTIVTITPVGSVTGAASLTCSVTYAGAGSANDPPTCSLSATQINLSAPSNTSTITLNTTPPTTALLTWQTNWNRTGWLAGTETALAVAVILSIVPRRKRLPVPITLILFFVCLAGSFGCGGGGSGGNSGSVSGTETPNPGTSPGNYTVAVTATSINLSTPVSTSAFISLLVQ